MIPPAPQLDPSSMIEQAIQDLFPDLDEWVLVFNKKDASEGRYLYGRISKAELAEVTQVLVRTLAKR